VFETFKTDRKRYVNDFMHIDNSDRKKTFSEAATKEMESSWQVDKLFEGDKLMGMLIDFYREAGHRVLNENQILMSRWSRFARTFGEIQKYDYLFKKRQESLQELYKDCVVRYERLYEIYMRKEIDAQMTEELEEQKRVRDERDGLAVLKQKETTKQTKRKEKSECSNVMNALGGDDLDLKQFHLTDFTIFVRWYIQTLNENADLDLFITKTKNLVQSDRAEFLSDYVLLSQLSPGDTLGDELEYYEGTNGFITQCAINPPKIEDFFVEYDTLVHDWKIETLIGQEDGRPFAYEVDHRFMDKVYDQAAELTLVPYEGLVTNEDPNSEGIKTNGIGGYNGNLGLDSSIVTLATIAGVNITLNKGKMPRMKNADWLECNILKPDFDAISLRNRQLINLLVETDMELKLEYDVLMLSDHEQIQSQLKDSAKRMWGRAASVPNCRPIMTKVSIIPQGKEQKSDSENLEIRYPKLFDMGFKIPTGNFEDRTDHILAEKKLAYGVILKTNEDTRKLEMEILNADPNKVFDKSNYIVPTVASVFAEHEVLGFQQLRYIKVREFRIKLLRQLNFFRSIEKRLAMDISAIKHPDPSSTINIFNGALADMLEKGEFFEIHHKSSKENVSEDVRTVMNDKIYISDRKGVNIIYGISNSCRCRRQGFRNF
jgi:hypothetical protein